MADELKLNARIEYTKGLTTRDVTIADLLSTVSGTLLCSKIQAITTSAVTLDLGGVVAGGYILIINRDATNFVKMYVTDAATVLARINPLEFALFRTEPSQVTKIIADTATCEVEFWLFSA